MKSVQMRGYCWSKYRKIRTMNNSVFGHFSRIEEWSKLTDKLRHVESIYKLKITILNFIRPKVNLVFDIHDTNGIALLSPLRLNFSHLNEYKFRHNFNDSVDSMCKCGLEPKILPHYLLLCNLISIATKD